MSSQSVRGTDLSGYTFTDNALRDASDYTRTLRERQIYIEPAGAGKTNPTWTRYSTGYLLEYQFGRFKCTNCTGNAFNAVGAVEDISGNIV
jgi:hypothetical protein